MPASTDRCSATHMSHRGKRKDCRLARAIRDGQRRDALAVRVCQAHLRGRRGGFGASVLSVRPYFSRAVTDAEDRHGMCPRHKEVLKNYVEYRPALAG